MTGYQELIEPQHLRVVCYFCRARIVEPRLLEVCKSCGRYTPQPWAVQGGRDGLPPELYDLHQALLKADQALAATRFEQAGPVAPDDEGESVAGYRPFGSGF
jgi:hypothetical protein